MNNYINQILFKNILKININIRIYLLKSYILYYKILRLVIFLNIIIK